MDPRLLGPDNLDDEDPVEAGDPVDRTRILIVDLKHARSLYDILRKQCGLTRGQIHKVGWDWRRPCGDERARKLLTSKIEQAPMGSVLIAHSTGGLLTRSVLAADPALCERLSAVISFGVPWVGTLKSMGVLLQREGLTAADKADARKVIAHSWAAIDLLPRVDAGLTFRGNGGAYDLFGSVDWLPERPLWLRRAVRSRLTHSLETLGVPDKVWRLPVDLHNVVGFGEPTTVSARIEGDAVTFNVGPHGEALGFDEVRQGDGTIPFSSAGSVAPASSSDRQVTNRPIPIGAYRGMGKKRHASLWANPGAVKTLLSVVGGREPEPLIELALDTSAYSPGTPIRIRYSLQEPGGDPMGGQIRILTPASRGGQGSRSTDPRGFGTMIFDRSDFAVSTVGTSRMRRVRAELTCSAGRTDVFALVPA